VEVNKGETN